MVEKTELFGLKQRSSVLDSTGNVVQYFAMIEDITEEEC
jgi:hypothetical protein